jgi:hypothetical protein
VCEGCGEYVMSNDEGRKREDDKYYHSECIKGRCGGCGVLVLGNDDRVRRPAQPPTQLTSRGRAGLTPEGELGRVPLRAA